MFKKCVLCWCLFISASIVFAQSEKEDPAAIRDAIKQAEECVASLISMQKNLPSRWASYQRRVVTNSAMLAESKIVQNTVQEIWAYDADSKVAYTRALFKFRMFEGSEVSDGFPMKIASYEAPNLVIEKIESKDWAVAEKKSDIGYPRTQPFNWSVGLYNSCKSGSMEQNDYLKGLFLNKGRKCLFAKRIDENLITSVWGKSNEPLPYALRVTFDLKRKLPVEYALVEFNGALTPEAVRSGAYKEVEKGKVEWKEFSLDQKVVGKTNFEKITLPVKVNLKSVMNQDEELEVNNEIFWKFGTDVPDSTFVNPLQSKIIEPKFDLD